MKISKLHAQALTTGLAMRSFVLASALATAFLCSLAQSRDLSERDQRILQSPKTSVAFDWDDTVLHLNHYDFAFYKSDNVPGQRIEDVRKALLTRPTFKMTSVELSKYGSYIGKLGSPLEFLELIGDDIDPIHGSFRHARPGPHPGRNYFADVMIEATTRKSGVPYNRVPAAYRAHFFDLYLQRSSNPATWIHTYINTARGHTEAEFQDGLRYLAITEEAQNMGYKPTPISHITQIGGTGPSHERKPITLLPTLKHAIDQGQHAFVFIDDSISNIRATARYFAAQFTDRPVIEKIWLIFTPRHQTPQLVDLSEYFRLRAARPEFSIEEFLSRELVVPEQTAQEKRQLELELKSLACRASFI